MRVSSEGRVALYLQDKHPLRDGMDYVRHAEEAGFEAVWQAESRLVREATVPMAAFAAVTERIKVGSGVVNPWTRNVGLMAATFVTLDDLAPGRVMLGIGAWWEPLASKVGVRRERPLTAMREYVEVVRRLVAMENVTFHGSYVDVEDIQIDIVHGDRSPRAVPIYVGATGMQMMELAGEVADGVLLNYLVGSKYNGTALEHLAAGAARAGRAVEDVDRPQLVVCSLDDDRVLALDRARELVTQYLGQQPHIMKASGVDPGLLDEIGEVLTWPASEEEIRRAMVLVPDEVVQMITASGTPDECRAKVREYVEAGCTCPVLYPLGDDVHAMIDAFAGGRFGGRAAAALARGAAMKGPAIRTPSRSPGGRTSWWVMNAGELRPGGDARRRPAARLGRGGTTGTSCSSAPA
jgi:5,10-methylenetetrahydromethanopterin reductase